MDEVFQFNQKDLIDHDNDVMILDVYYEIFIWEGTSASAAEKRMASTVAMNYVEQSTDGREKNIPITTVQAGKESALFKCHFQGWVEKTEVITTQLIGEKQVMAPSVGGWF